MTPISISRSTARCGEPSAPGTTLHRDQPHHPGQESGGRFHRAHRRTRARSSARGQWPGRDIEMGPQINKQQIETSATLRDSGAKKARSCSAEASASPQTGHAKAHSSRRPSSARSRVDAHRAGGGLRPGAERDRMRAAWKMRSAGQRNQVRPVDRALLARREQRLPRHSRSRGGHHLRQRTHHRRRSALCPLAASSRPATATAKAAPERIDFYTTWKSVYVDYSDKLQRAQID